MIDDLFQRAKALFLEAVDVPDDGRQAWLDERCLGDDELRAEVEKLLGHDNPDSTWHGTPAAPAALRPGDVVARRYRLLSELGEGGFGVVYEAEQTEGVRRVVAIKVIKPGMDTRAVTARFEAERQALALMDHPGVARVLDGGATDEGRPFFVMELVKGLPVTDHCDKHRLTLSERLQLFIQICEAVQHAHAKGVIHRDLKPSNILVEYKDGKSIARVIDFGVAKALNQQLAEEQIFTQEGQLLGTPEYMSPEQAESSVEGIDTRSDVYSLGVVLYELLTGFRPFEPETLRRAGLAEIQRIIREVDPAKPSTRLSSVATSGDGPGAATRIASARATDLRSLQGTLRRDLDWVVMRCLEKSRDRRYPTANELAADLARFLNGEPVEAGPPSVRYRAGKFIRRNRLLVSAASAVLLALVVGLVATLLSLRQARQRIIAIQESEAQTRFFVRTFGIDQESGMPSLAIKDVVQRATEALDDELSDHDLPRTKMSLELGKMLVALEPSLPTLEYARKARDDAELHGTELERLKAAMLVADAKYGLARSNAARLDVALLKEARSAYDAVAASNAVGTDVDELRRTAEVSSIITDRYLGEVDRAEQRITAFLAEVEASHPSSLHHIRALETLGEVHRDRKDNERSLEATDRALAIIEGSEFAGRDTHWTILNNRALAFLGLERVDDAIKSFKGAFDLLEVAFPDGHLESVTVLSNIAYLYDSTGRTDEAILEYERAISMAARVTTFPCIAREGDFQRLRLIYSRKKEHAEVLRLTLKCLQDWTLRDPNHINVVMAMADVARTQFALGQFGASLLTFEQLEERATETGVPNMIVEAVASQVECLRRLNRTSESIDTAVRNVETHIRLFGGESERTKRQVEKLIEYAEQAEQEEKAAEYRSLLTAPDGDSDD